VLAESKMASHPRNFSLKPYCRSTSKRSIQGSQTHAPSRAWAESAEPRAGVPSLRNSWLEQSCREMFSLIWRRSVLYWQGCSVWGQVEERWRT
jgi:hypothetical protein